MKNLITCLAVCALSSATFATTWTVDDDGKADFDSLQAALDDVLVVDGDEIIVGPGTYTSTAPYEVVDMRGKAVWMHSSAGPEFTFIDGENTRRGIHSTGSVKLIIEGFTIHNCYGHTGGGGMYTPSGAKTLKDCIFINNAAIGNGGGIMHGDDSLILENCIFTNNTATSHGGGIYSTANSTLTNCTFDYNVSDVNGGGMLNYGTNAVSTLTDCSFLNNTANHVGGGMQNWLSESTLTNCTFTNNTAAAQGGGMQTDTSSPTLVGCTFTGNNAPTGGGMQNYSAANSILINCTFTNNTATTHGGGMFNSNSSSPSVTNCTFAGNTAGTDGGGMYNDTSNPNLADCIFNGNSSVERGGGIYNYESSPVLTNCTFENNTSSDGAGMCSYNYCNPILTDCTFENNTADAGGGMRNSWYSSPTLTGCTFENNTAYGLDWGGGGIFNYDESSPVLVNCSFKNNSSNNLGGAILNYYGSSPHITTCIFCGNNPNDIDGSWQDEGDNTFNDFCWSDCNDNGIDDLEDIANQTSFDCDGNDVPDECQPDCDGDGYIDPCDIDYGGETDYNDNGIPDNCELDCNENEYPDDWEIEVGLATDCNQNGIPDDCDLVNGGQIPEGAVQWSVAEGGNGHWYLAIDHGDYLCWADAHATATKLGGYLVTLTSSEENEWVKYGVASDPDLWSDSWGPMNGGPMIGGYADENEVYRWVSDESWGYTDWHPGNPNEGRNSIIILFDLNGDSNGYGWQDISADSCEAVTSFVVEFEGMPTSNDCNSNGLLDSCEIADDPSLDCNGNGIPDDCDIVNGGQIPEDAVQWTIEEGGNGHWYTTIYPAEEICWSDASDQANYLGGYLTTITSQLEQDFINQHSDNTMRAWLGGTSANGDWQWVTGETWGYTNWHPSGDHGFDSLGKDYGVNQGLWDGFDSCNFHPSYIVECEVANSTDCNDNGVLDSCEIADDPSLDCNGNGTLDSCEDFDDCNYNEIPDSCDISSGTSNDVNMNGVPDECESDCNENGIPDDWEIKKGLVFDCNENMLPDECDIADGTSTDVNSNAVPDECEDDCNGNGLPDSWDIETGAALDCNNNGIPDSCDVASGCDTDCNLNGVPDSCDIANGTSEDINANNVPDACECIADITGDGVVDIHDLLALIGYWGSPGPLGDFNADGIVKIQDILILISGWGECTNIICNDDPPIGAVQWTIEEGGNGHWYGTVLVPDDVDCFDEIRLIALDLGGEMVIIQSEAENSFVIDLLDGTSDYLIGLIQNLSSPDYSEPGGGWEWVDGTPLDNSFWHSSEPDDTNGTQNFCGIYSGGWYDVYECDYGKPQSAVVEWSN